MTLALILWLFCGVLAWLQAMYKLYLVFPQWNLDQGSWIPALRALPWCIAMGPLALIYWIVV